MAKEVTLWCMDRRRALAQARARKEPAVARRDLLYRVRKGGTSVISPESAEGEEWCLKHISFPVRLARSFVVGSKDLPALVEAAERAGLVACERFRSTGSESGSERGSEA